MRVYDKRTGKKVWEYICPYHGRLVAHMEETGAKGGLNPSQGGNISPELDAKLTAVLLEHNAKCLSAKRGAAYTLGGRGGAEACSPVVLEVPLPDGTIMPVVHDGNRFLYRLEDGKVLTGNMPKVLGASPIRSGNVLMHHSNTGLDEYMVRLTAKDRDTLDLRVALL